MIDLLDIMMPRATNRGQNVAVCRFRFGDIEEILQIWRDFASSNALASCFSQASIVLVLEV